MQDQAGENHCPISLPHVLYHYNRWTLRICRTSGAICDIESHGFQGPICFDNSFYSDGRDYFTLAKLGWVRWDIFDWYP